MNTAPAPRPTGQHALDAEETELPHASYMAAVAAALDAWDIDIHEWWADVEDDRLDGVYRLPDDGRGEHWPHGVYLSWDQSAGWTLIEAGGGRNLHPLPNCRLFADPQQVAADTRARLTHGLDGWDPGPLCLTDRWDPRATVAAVAAFAADEAAPAGAR